MYNVYQIHKNKFSTIEWSTNLWILLTIKGAFYIVFIVLGIAKCFKASKALYQGEKANKKKKKIHLTKFQQSLFGKV